MVKKQGVYRTCGRAATGTPRAATAMIVAEVYVKANLRIPCRLSMLLLGVLLFGAVSAEPDGPGLEIRVAARELAPGEPVRVEAHTAVALTELGGSLGERRFEMAPCARAAPGGCWTGWSMIGLDDLPGMLAIELTGRTTDGRVIVGTRALTVEAKSFPEERLTVSSKYVEPPAGVQERLKEERSRLAGIYRSTEPPAALDGPFVRPVPGDPTSTFGKRRIFNDKPRSPHPGLDLRAATGTTVLASGPGRVVLARELYYSGNTVIVDHGGRLFTLYAHLSKIEVAEAETVASGQPIGLSGATGRVTGPHLHWGAKIGSEPFDPTALLEPTLFE